MTITLSEFRRQADKHGICEMSKEWDNCKSKKQLIDLALSIRGIEYIAKAVSEGWGIDAETICREFAPFINGKYVREKDGYTSALYCSFKEESPAEIYATQTALLVINFIGKIYIPMNRICEIHAVNSKFYAYGDGAMNLYRYGDNEIYNTDDTPTKINIQQ